MILLATFDNDNDTEKADYHAHKFDCKNWLGVNEKA